MLEDVLIGEYDDGYEEGDKVDEDEGKDGEGGNVLDDIEYIRGPVS